ncbi:hypothetical protein NQ314_012023 [Rhamnusium bicolor]|uniref:15-oxoprostaglandin 13-reductase n=1 Tax=Rhamnusium bicolor TaxID=1586634 RepID=A0AAV8XF66_9CUCU|nr:hypothetical protein NQ314_012023 [Rhamnusium bicolor]
MRIRAATLKLGETFIGIQLAKIVESKNPKYPVGQYVTAHFGWRSHTISDGSPINGQIPALVPNFGGLPLSLALGVLGRPGVGETVVVTGAGGAVGSHVGQIAKIKGCKVIGITGSDEKGRVLVEELGFDHFINYKIADVDKALTELAPEGVDCYFDNVGGEISSTILRHMNTFGRISVCGGISAYNETDLENLKVSTTQRSFISLQLKMEGFQVIRWFDRWNEGTQQNLKWIKEGKLKYKETVTEGFENMFTAFTNMLRGGNIGKAIVKV